MEDLRYLIEQTVVSLDKSGLTPSSCQDLFRRLYLFHYEYDEDITNSFWFQPEYKTKIQAEKIDTTEEYPLLGTIHEVVEILHRKEKYTLLSLWFLVLIKYIFWNAEEEDRTEIETLSPFLQEEEVYEQLQANIPFMDGLTAVQQEWDDLPPFTKEWLTAFQNWDMQSYTDPERILGKLVRLFSEKDYRGAFHLAQNAQVYYPGHALIILYESISAVMHMQGRGVVEPEAYASFVEKLSALQNLDTAKEENTYIIQTHARYYLAIAKMMTGEYSESEKLLHELIQTYRMPGAEELLEFVRNAQN